MRFPFCLIPVFTLLESYTELTEVCEAALALVYPLQWEFGYVPVLPSRMGDLLQSPSPIIAGLLSSYAGRVFRAQGVDELS